jgi:hypothetical protein
MPMRLAALLSAAAILAKTSSPLTSPDLPQGGHTVLSSEPAYG